MSKLTIGDLNQMIRILDTLIKDDMKENLLDDAANKNTKYKDLRSKIRNFVVNKEVV